MALFEVFIPGREAGTPNVTMTLEAPNWIGALRSGLKSIGEGQEAIANVMCDIKEDNSIHVTDVATRRVFRLREVQPPKVEEEAPTVLDAKRPDTGPRPISIPDAAPVDAEQTEKNERPPGFASPSPKTLVEFPAPKLAPLPAPPAPMATPPSVTPPPASRPAVATAPEHSVPWTAMPPPGPPHIPDPRTLVSPGALSDVPGKIAPAPVTAAATPMPARPAAPPPSPGVAPAPLSSAAAPSPSPSPSPPSPSPSSSGLPPPTDGDTMRLDVATVTGSTARPRAPSAATPMPFGPPTPRGVPAPAPRRPSGQFSEAPSPVSREVSKPDPRTDPHIGRTVHKERDHEQVDVQEAIAAVFDATQDLYMEEAQLSAQHVADKLLDIALAHIPADAGTFYLADVNGHALTFAAVRGPKADALKRSGMTVPVGQGIIGFCAQEGVCLAVSDIQKDPRFLAWIARTIDYQPTDTLCASAEKEGRLFGAVQLINSRAGFDAAHMEVLRFIGLTAAAMLERVAERE